MSAFFDTNIFDYAVSQAPGDAGKRRLALTLIEDSEIHHSIQVVQKFLHTCLRKSRIGLNSSALVQSARWLLTFDCQIPDATSASPSKRRKNLTPHNPAARNLWSRFPPNSPKPHHPMKMIKTIVTAIVALSAVHFALALPPKKMDANKDGVVSLEEFKTFYIEVDRLTDKDGDGFITAQEWPTRERHHFGPTDTDKDGRLSLEEVMQMRLNHFKTMDKNGNGVLESEI